MLRKKMLKSKFLITLLVLCFFFGLTLLSYNYLQGKIEKAYNDMNLRLMALNKEQPDDSLENEVNEEVIDNTVYEDIKENKEEEKKDYVEKIDYIAKLSIPKISLNHGLTAINSKYNNVHYGIETLKASNYPDVINGNLILASHSGTSYRSIFKNLYKLNVNDKCYIEYKGKTYTYVITKIYNVEKSGRVVIERDYHKTTLTLITCTKNSDQMQTIYICELI